MVLRGIFHDAIGFLVKMISVAMRMRLNQLRSLSDNSVLRTVVNAEILDCSAYTGNKQARCRPHEQTDWFIAYTESRAIRIYNLNSRFK